LERLCFGDDVTADIVGLPEQLRAVAEHVTGAVDEGFEAR
jgi:hypothetical protein